MANFAEILVAARTRQAAGDLAGAVEGYRQAIQLDPASPVAHLELGELLAHLGALEEAEAVLRRALVLAPDTAAVHFSLATVLCEQNRLAEAADGYRRAIALKADFAEAHASLAAIDGAVGRAADAIAGYRRALALQPGYPIVQHNLALLLSEHGQLEEAADCWRRAIALDPGFVAAHNGLGTAYDRQGKVAAAADCYRRAQELAPDDFQANHNLGAALIKLGRPAASLEFHERAIAREPDNRDSHCNYGIALLMAGHRAAGWYEYEWWRSTRLHTVDWRPPRYRLDDLNGRTVLLRCEQGSGDSLQFIRYAELVRRRAARVVVECSPALARLLASCPGVDGVIVAGEPLPAMDLMVPVLSLATLFETTLDTIPANVPYLAAEPETVSAWQRELAGQPGVKVGIAWQGDPKYAGDGERSFPLSHFARLVGVPGLRLYSLQWGTGREQLAACEFRSSIVDFGERLGDFHNTAAIVRNLDLVITCDSALGHLAGAIGAPVWNVQPLVPNWRWLLERDDSPWYPTLRLFRQRASGDWAEVFERIEAELRTLCANGR